MGLSTAVGGDFLSSVRGHGRGTRIAAAILFILGAAAVVSPAAWASTRGASPVPATTVNCTTTTAISFSGTPTKGVIATPGADACFTFSTADGDVIWFNMAATSGSLSLFDDVYRPGPLSTCAGPFDGPGECDVPTGASGTWTLQVSDSSGTHTGTFDVSIQRLDAPLGCKGISFGKNAVKGKVTAAAASSCFTFSGSAGDDIFARAVGISGKLGAPTLALVSPDGSEPCLYNEGGEQECPLAESGTQTLLLYSTFETTTGSFRIYDQQLTSPQHCTALTVGGSAQSGKVAKAGDVACFTFAGTNGETVTTTLAKVTGSLSPLVDDFRPTGTSACATPGDSLECALDTTGTWTTLISDDSASDKGAGSFSMSIATP